MPRRSSRRAPRVAVAALVLLAMGWLAVQAHEAGWVDLGGFYAVLTGEPPPPRPSDGPQTAGSFSPDDVPGSPSGSAADATLRLVSWNIANMGGSKDAAEIAVMADVLHEARADVVTIQEVLVSQAGDDAVARLVDALAARGGPWDYTLSNPTSGRAAERYAFLWRTDRARPVGIPVLFRDLADLVDREPFLMRFVRVGAARAEPVLVGSFHAVPTSRDPARENALLPAVPALHPEDDLLLCGDFNLPASRPAFDGLRAGGFVAALDDELTTYKAVESPSGERRASAYDNCFYRPDGLTVTAAGALDFSGRLPTLRETRAVSDHLPVYVHLAWP